MNRLTVPKFLKYFSFSFAVFGFIIIYLFTYHNLNFYYQSDVYILNGKFYQRTSYDSLQLEIPKKCISKPNTQIKVKSVLEGESNKDMITIGKISSIWSSKNSDKTLIIEILECIKSYHLEILNKEHRDYIKHIVKFTEENGEGANLEVFEQAENNKNFEIEPVEIMLISNSNSHIENLKSYGILFNPKNFLDSNHPKLINTSSFVVNFRLLKDSLTKQIGDINHKKLFSTNELIIFSLLASLNFLILFVTFILLIKYKSKNNKSL